MPVRSKRILRLLEDYTPDPSAPSQEGFSSKNLLLEVGNRKDGWLMVKQLDCYDSVPGWVPERLVTKPTPGFYRLRKDMEFELGELKVASGHMVKASDPRGKWSLFRPPLARKVCPIVHCLELRFLQSHSNHYYCSGLSRLMPIYWGQWAYARGRLICLTAEDTFFWFLRLT